MTKTARSSLTSRFFATLREADRARRVSNYNLSNGAEQFASRSYSSSQIRINLFCLFSILSALAFSLAFSTAAWAAPSEVATNASATNNTAQANAVSFQPAELRRCESIRKRLVNNELTRIFDKAFPAYIEFCAASTWQKRGATDGGNYGHAFGMIHGACIDRDTNGLPKVPQQFVPCPGGTVGFSTESVMFSSHWIAGDGRNFMLYGDHDPGQPFDLASWKRIQKGAFDIGMFHGVGIQPWAEKEITAKALAAGMDREEYRRTWIGEYTFGTEFALASARGGVDCTRIPLVGSRPGAEDRPLKIVLETLNQMNRKAFAESKITPPGKTEPVGFDYDGIVNNCAHSVYNALVSLGMWPKKNNSGHPFKYYEVVARATDGLVPFNQMLDAYILGSQLSTDTMIKRFRRNRQDFQAFKDNGWYATQVGTSIDSVPALTYMNSIYDPSNHTNFLTISDTLRAMGAKAVKTWIRIEVPTYQPLRMKLEQLKTDQSGPAVNLISNLELWREQYSRALADLRARQDQDDVVSEVTLYIERKLAETEGLLSRANELTPSAIPLNCADGN